MPQRVAVRLTACCHATRSAVLSPCVGRCWTLEARALDLQRSGDVELSVVDEPAHRFQDDVFGLVPRRVAEKVAGLVDAEVVVAVQVSPCLLYTSDAADEEDSVDLGCRRIIKKKKKKIQKK